MARLKCTKMARLNCTFKWQVYKRHLNCICIFKWKDKSVRLNGKTKVYV